MEWLGFPEAVGPSEAASNIAGAYVQAQVAAVLLVASLGLWLVARSRAIWPAFCACLFLLHPAWTVGIQANDGARQKLEIAYVFTVLAAITLLAQLCQVIWDRRRGVAAAKGA